MRALQKAVTESFAFHTFLRSRGVCVFQLGVGRSLRWCEGARRATLCPALSRLVGLDLCLAFCVNTAKIYLVVLQEETEEVMLFDLVSKVELFADARNDTTGAMFASYKAGQTKPGEYGIRLA